LAKGTNTVCYLVRIELSLNVQSLQASASRFVTPGCGGPAPARPDSFLKKNLLKKKIRPIVDGENAWARTKPKSRTPFDVLGPCPTITGFFVLRRDWSTKDWMPALSRSFPILQRKKKKKKLPSEARTKMGAKESPGFIAKNHSPLATAPPPKGRARAVPLNFCWPTRVFWGFELEVLVTSKSVRKARAARRLKNNS